MNRTTLKHVAVVGGGITGCAVAFFLNKKNYKVTLIESAPSLGGLAGSFSVDGAYIDYFYHHFYTSDKAITSLAGELGLEKDIIWRKTKTAVFANRKIYDISSPLSLIKFKPLSLKGRLKLALLAFKTGRARHNSAPFGEKVREWVIKQAGEEVYNTLWQPLLCGKFGEAGDEIDAAWLWSKFRMRGKSRSGGGKETLGYLKGGIQRLFNAVEEKLKRVDFIKNTEVVSVKKTANKKLKLELAGGKTEEFDAAVITTPAPKAAGILSYTASEFAEKLKFIRYLGASCAVLLTDKPAGDIYWLNNTDPKTPLLGVIEHTNLADPKDHGGYHCIYLPRYLPPDHPDMQADPEKIIQKRIAALKNIYSDFETNCVKKSFLQATPYGQPLVTAGYGNIVPSPHTGVENLYYLSMCMIFPEDRQMDNSVIMAEKLVKKEF